MVVFAYGKWGQRHERPRSGRFGFLAKVLVVSALLASPFLLVSTVLGQVVAVGVAVGWYVGQLYADWRAGRLG